MNVKIFKIRISRENLQNDQKRLNDFLQTHDILKSESTFVNNEEQFWSVILYYNKIEGLVKETKSSKYSADDEVLNSEENKILEALKLWRSEKAKEHNLPVYFIATNMELASLAKFKPVKKEELQEIKGFGKHKIENYGEEIIEILYNV